MCWSAPLHSASIPDRHGIHVELADARAVSSGSGRYRWSARRNLLSRWQCTTGAGAWSNVSCMSARSSKVSLRSRRLWTASTMCLMHSSCHCFDILIVLRGTSPVHIPTAEQFYSRTVKLKELLLCTRAKNALESKLYYSTFRPLNVRAYRPPGH